MVLKKSDRFPSKVLLFGEYLVLSGSTAISVPYEKYSLERRFSLDDTLFSEVLTGFKTYISDNNLMSASSVSKFEDDINNGLSYNSDIPIGYGLGSSGALTADIYAHYSENQPSDLTLLKEELAKLENYFHEKSSGIDPLTSYIRKPIMYNIDGVETLSDKYGLDKFCLHDSGISRNAKNAINHYKKLSNNSGFKKRLLILSELNSELINSFLSKNLDLDLFKRFSEMQFKTMTDFIDEKTKIKWEEGLDSDAFYMKLCGAGMGGFYLVYNNST